MSSKYQIQSLTEDTICPICLDFFGNPTTLFCGHNFCRSCVRQWRASEGRISCPLCREEFTSDVLRVNRALASTTEKARARSLNTEGKESKFHCQKHLKQLTLFCETDKELICLICRDAREHRQHRFMSIQEAVENYKEQIKTSLETLTENKSAMEEMEQQQKQTMSDIVEDAQKLETYIISIFAELHKILNEKEENIFMSLKEQEGFCRTAMEDNLDAIQEELNFIQKELLKLQEQMDQKDSLIFLEEQTRQKRRLSVDDQMLTLANGALNIGRFDQPFWLNTELRETIDSIKRDSVTLDVRTAHAVLEVSQSWKRVRRGTWKDHLPDTCKRFTVNACMLGLKGFTSGRHYWEVEVAGSQRWSLGVAAESVERKGWDEMIPKSGVWRIGRWDDDFDALTSPRSPLPSRPIPGRVGVYLSYEFGTVSFYDADTKSLLYTFTGNKFTEKMYPIFVPYDDQWLRICSGSAPGV